MRITDVRIRKLYREGKLRAVVSITIDDAIAIHDIKIISGSQRLFVAMPSRREENGTFRDIVHPINPEMRKEIEDLILENYEHALGSLQVEEELSGDKEKSGVTAEPMV